MASRTSQGFLFILFICLACSAHRAETGDSKEDVNPGILKGTITIGPLRPGPQRIDEETVYPTELFASHKIVILSVKDQSPVKEVKPDPKGAYKIELPPGEYLVDFLPHDIGVMRKQKEPLPKVTIKAGETVTLDLDFDTGMR